jgi:hypothetical protein
VASLVTGLFAVLLCWTVVGGLLLGVGAVVLAVLARRRVRRGEAVGSGVATAGLVLGAVGIAGGLVVLVLSLWILDGDAGREFVSCMREAQTQEEAGECQQRFRDRIGDSGS